MIAQYIELGDRGWSILVYYNINQGDFEEVEDSLRQFGCPTEDIEDIYETLRNKNTGFTVSDERKRMSIIGIGTASSRAQFLNTLIHEIDHVQSHICDYYNVDMNSEQAAYLIGYIGQQTYKAVSTFIKHGRL